MHDEAIFRTLIPGLLEDRLQAGLAHALGRGADGAEVFLSVSRSSKAKVQNGALEDLTTSKRGGLGFRVLRDGRTGIATTTDLARVDFCELVDLAFDLAELGDQDPWLRQAEPAGADDLPSRYDAACDVVRRAAESGRTIRETVLADGLVSADRFDELLSAEAVCRLGMPDTPRRGSEE